MQISEEERKRRSEAAKQLVKAGKFGGKQKGSGRPRKERAQEVVAEKIKTEGENIFKALKAALNSDSDATRLKAALSMLEIETKEEEFQIKEEQRQYENLGKDAILELIFTRIKELDEKGIAIPGFDFEGFAREVRDGGIEEDASSTRRALGPAAEPRED